MSSQHYHREPVPTPDDDPLPDKHPVPDDDPVPHPDPVLCAGNACGASRSV